MIVRCEEKWAENRDAADAVWVPNGSQLYYPNVSTCITVTLVFQNGLLGGHASQDTPDGAHQPAQNLQDVIRRMMSLADVHTPGAFKRICFIGTTDEKSESDPIREKWELDQATALITKTFGQPSAGEALKQPASNVDIVFDTGKAKFYIAGHKKDQTAAQTIEQAKEWKMSQKYV